MPMTAKTHYTSTPDAAGRTVRAADILMETLTAEHDAMAWLAQSISPTRANRGFATEFIRLWQGLSASGGAIIPISHVDYGKRPDSMIRCRP